MTRVCFINFTGERVNWGCQATSLELLRLLNKFGLEGEEFLFDLVPLLPHHQLDRDIPEQHGLRLRKCLASPHPTIKDVEFVEKLVRRRYGHFVDDVENADIVLFQGEGTMTGTDFLRADRLLLLPWIAKHKFGKPVIALNQTVFSSDVDFSRALFVVLNGFDKVWVREPQSLQWLHENGVVKAELVPDTAFLTDPLAHVGLPEWTGQDSAFFCVTGSASIAEEHVEPYLNAVQEIIVKTGLKAVFTCSTAADRMLVERAEQVLAPASFEAIAPSVIYPAIAELFRRSKFLLGGRYHMSLLASITGTPSVLIHSNTFKMRGLSALLEQNWEVRAFTQTDEIVADSVRCANWSARERDALWRRAHQIRAQITECYQSWHRLPEGAPVSVGADRPYIPVEQDAYFSGLNSAIAGKFKFPDLDNKKLASLKSHHIRRMIGPLSVYMRRDKQGRAAFRCIEQLAATHLAQMLKLNARWLVSICDSYADYGDEIQARNALLISSFVNWERLVATYLDWAQPGHSGFESTNAAPDRRVIFDGLTNVDMRQGDTTNNLLKRYDRALQETPVLHAIWRELLGRIASNDSLLSAFNKVHGHIFDENTDWLRHERNTQVPSWRK